MDERTLDILLDEVGRRSKHAPGTLADSVTHRISLLEKLSPAWGIAAIPVAVFAVAIAGLIGFDSTRDDGHRPPELALFSSQPFLAEPAPR